MAKRCGVHHVALRVQDMDKTVEFYNKIGCSVIRSWGEGNSKGVMMDLGGGNILEMFAGGVNDPEQKPRYEHLALKSDDVDADFADALAAGAAPQIEPKDAMLGGIMPIRIAFVVGPNQEVIEFFCEK